MTRIGCDVLIIGSGAAGGVLAATLSELTRTTAMLGPGDAPKISRREVKRLLASGTLLVMSNRGVNWLIERAAGRRLPAVVLDS